LSNSLLQASIKKSGNERETGVLVTNMYCRWIEVLSTKAICRVLHPPSLNVSVDNTKPNAYKFVRHQKKYATCKKMSNSSFCLVTLSSWGPMQILTFNFKSWQNKMKSVKAFVWKETHGRSKGLVRFLFSVMWGLIS